MSYSRGLDVQRHHVMDRDAQEQFSGFATLQGEGETDALNSSNSREESEKHQGAAQLVSVLREWDKGCG